MHVPETDENYLEQILILCSRDSFVRQTDVCAAMGYSRPTVSVKLRELRDKGYLNIDRNGSVTLTEQGNAVATLIFERHNVIAKMLMAIGTSEEVAYADACKIEHDISEESFQNIKKYLKQYEK